MLCTSMPGYCFCVIIDKKSVCISLCADVDLIKWMGNAKCVYTLLLQYLIAFQFVICLFLKHLAG